MSVHTNFEHKWLRFHEHDVESNIGVGTCKIGLHNFFIHLFESNLSLFLFDLLILFMGSSTHESVIVKLLTLLRHDCLY